MKSVKERLQDAKIYCVTSELSLDEYPSKVEAVCRGGADIVQLRNKSLSTRAFLETAKSLSKVCRKYGTIFIVNDRLDVALMCGADGVHLGQEDLPIEAARQLANRAGAGAGAGASADAGEHFVIGCSTHSLAQALKAQQQGADYLGCGPIYATPTKPTYPKVGLELVNEYRKNIAIPFVAIGGITAENIVSVKDAGARCAAVVRAAFGAKDIEVAVQQLKEKM